MLNQRPSRREFLTLAAGAFAVAAVPGALRSRSKLHTRSLPAMGTTAELAVNHHDERYAQAAMKAALQELKRVESLMTRFDASSDIGRANSAAGQRRVDVSPETASVVERALQWAGTTQGGFDPAIARVVDLWDVKHRTTPPQPDAVQRLAGRSFYRHIDVDASAARASIYIRDPEAALDLGGIAAGYGVDRAVDVLREWGVRSAYINVGGDIFALGTAADDEPWQVGVRSPADADQLIATIPLEDGAIATTGDYEQGYNYRGRRYHHVMDPQRAEPRVSALHTVTIVAASCIDADAASTAVFGMPRAAAERILSVRSPSSRIVSIG
jgi:FAD:protein FMN transferase